MNLLKQITVEPSLLLFLVVHDFVIDLNTNLFLQKSCRFDRNHEPDLTTKCDDEKRGVLFVSEVFLKFNWINLLLSAIFTMFLLPWSDKAGRRRRPVIFIPIIGLILHSLSGCVHSYFWHWPPLAAVLSATVFRSSAQGAIIMIPACQVYICDTCSAENRTARLGLIGAIHLVSQILGKGGSGFVLRRFGFLYSYLLCFAFSTLSLAIGFVLIKDTSVFVEKKIPLYRMFANIRQSLIDNVGVIFHKNLGIKRIVVTLLMISNAAVIFTYYGELTVLYQYLRYRFGWNEQTFSGYLLYKFSTSALGIAFCSLVLSKFFKVHDGLIGILASTFDTLAILALFFATEPWQIYFIPLIDIFHGTVSTLTVSFMSKYYPSNELGRLSAVINLFRLTMALSSSAYNGIYRATLDTFPTAFCILSIFLDVAIFLCFFGAYILSERIDERAATSKDPHPKVSQDGEVPESLL